MDRLWAERAAVTAEMAQLDASGDYGRSAAERYEQLENRRDIIDTDIRSQLSSDLSGTGLQEPGDLEAYLREQAEQAGAQPGAYDQLSVEDQRRFIKAHAPDYEAARSAEAARRLGEAMGGPLGEAWGQLGMGLAAGALGSRALRRGARAGAGRFGGAPAEVGSGGAPALRGDPYHPDSVEARIMPPYEANPADKPGPSYDFNKTPEPLDARSVYNRSLLAKLGTWYGRSSTGEYYRFSLNRAGKIHFSGTVDEARVPPETLRKLKQVNP